MKIQDTLRSFGLSRNAADSYLALLSRGQQSIAELGKHTKLHRPSVYKAIGELLEKNLVSKASSGKRVLYVAEKPTKLIGSVHDLRISLEEALPELLELYEQDMNKPTIRYFEGKDGIKKVYEDLIENTKKGDVLYRYESPRDYEKNKKLYPKGYREHTSLDSSYLEKFVITNEPTHAVRGRRIWRHSKPIPASFDAFDYNITELIYGNTVAFIDYDSLSSSIIVNPRFAEFQKKIFMLLFGKLGNLK